MNSNDKPSSLANSIIRFLDCPCQFFPSSEDGKPLLDAFQAAREQGKTDGFTPILVSVDDILWECLYMNADEEGEEDNSRDDFDMEHVRDYRERMLKSDLQEGSAYLAETLQELAEDGEEGNSNWAGEPLDEGDGEQGDEGNHTFCGYWRYDTKATQDVILAKIPTRKPWQIFAWLPFGGWNECPDTLGLMAVAKHWYETYGAVPATLSHDVLEFIVNPIKDEETGKKLAMEQYAFCPDIIDQGVGSIGALANHLMKSTVWFFWWD